MLWSYRYYAAFPSLSDKCDLLAGTCSLSPVDPAWARVAQTHPKAAEDIKSGATDSGVNSAPDDTDGGGRSFSESSRSGNLSGSHRRHRKPRRHDDGRRRRQGLRRMQAEWGGTERTVWPASMCGLPWLFTNHDGGGHMSYWPLQPNYAGFSQPALMIDADWSVPESYKDRFLDLASSQWRWPSFEEGGADPALRSTRLQRSSNEDSTDVLHVEQATATVSRGSRHSSELSSHANNAQPDVASTDSSIINDAEKLESKAPDTQSLVGVNSEPVVVADRLIDDLGNSFSPHDVRLSVLHNSAVALSLNIDPLLIDSNVTFDDDDPFLGCRPFDPELWNILNSARMLYGNPTLPRELHLLQRPLEPNNSYDVSLRLFDVDSSMYSWSDIESVIDCSGCFEGNDRFSLPSPHDNIHTSELSPSYDAQTAGKLPCTKIIGNEAVWDGSRIAEAVLENSAVVTALGAEAVRQIWQPVSCWSTERISLSSCEDVDSTIDDPQSYSQCELETGSLAETTVNEHCVNRFRDWTDRCHCVRCIWQCELLSGGDVDLSPSWPASTAVQDSKALNEDSTGDRLVPHLAQSASESSIFWNEFQQDDGNTVRSSTWNSQLFALEYLEPSPVDCDHDASLKNHKTIVDGGNNWISLKSDDTVFESRGLSPGLLALNAGQKLSFPQAKEDQIKDSGWDDEKGASPERIAYNDYFVHLANNDGAVDDPLYLGNLTEVDETRKCFHLSGTKSADASAASTGVESVASVSSSACDTCTTCHPVSSLLTNLLEMNNNKIPRSDPQSAVPECCGDCEEIVELLPNLSSVSDIVFSDTDESSESSEPVSSSSLSDASVFSSPEPCIDQLELSEFDAGPESLTVLGGSFDHILRLELGGELCSAAQCYIGSFLAPVYTVDGSSLWFRDSHYISANVDALARLRSGLAQSSGWLPPPSLAHESVCTSAMRPGCLLPSENTAFRDDIPQRLEPLVDLEPVLNTLHPLMVGNVVRRSSECLVSPHLWPPPSVDESLSVTVMPNHHLFRPIGTPSTTDSDLSETSIAAAEAITTGDSLGDYSALVMGDMLIDSSGTYQRFVIRREHETEGNDGGVECGTFQPSFKVHNELEKAAQTGELSPPVSLATDTDLCLGFLVNQVLSQLSSEFPEAANNLDDILSDTISDTSCRELQNVDEVTVAMSQQLSVIWDDVIGPADVKLEPCPPATSGVSAATSQESQIWTDSTATVTDTSSSPCFMTIHGRHLSDIWSDATTQLADSAYINDSADLLPSSVPDIWKDSSRPPRIKVDNLRRTWKSVDSEDTSAISDGRMFPMQSAWSHSRPSSVTADVETLSSVMEDRHLVADGYNREPCSAEGCSDECDVSPSELDVLWGTTSSQKSSTTNADSDAETHADHRSFFVGGLDKDSIWSHGKTNACTAESCEAEVQGSWNVDPLYCSGNQTSVAVLGGDNVPPDSAVDPLPLWISSESSLDADVAFAFTHLVSGVVRGSSLFS